MHPHQKKWVTPVEWFANVMLWISGTALAAAPDMAKNSWELFALLFAGQVLWGMAAYSVRKWSLVAGSVYFCLLNAFGVYVRL